MKRVCFEYEGEVYVVEVPHTHEYFNVVLKDHKSRNYEKLTEKGIEYCKQKIKDEYEQ